MKSLKESLLEHLRKEGERHYPVLRKEAEHNKNLKKEVDVFAMDPEYVSRVVSEFFDKYSGGEIDENFSINLESLYATLTARIRNEEEALYEEYETINR